ncbi:MAG: hypothetical protein FD123_598 [Bacteroidetes bacterium]|nr:MAG: hypothetical protein FD123_598 [Bacteroidota bacterium]
MKATNDLHRLLHSLSQAEKRYIKVAASKQLIENENIALFDAILNQEEYDEKKLKEQLKGKSLVRHLSSSKNYLYRFVLKSMRMFHAERSVDKQLKELLMDARFLYDRGLYELSWKELEKAKKLAYEYEMFLVILEILFIERLLVVVGPNKDMKARIDAVHEERKEVMRKLHSFAELMNLSDTVFVKSRSNYHLRDEKILAELYHVAKSDLFINPPQEDSFEVYYQYLFARGIFHMNMGDFEQAYTYYHKQIEHWESHPRFIRDGGQRFKKSLFNYLNCCLGLGRFEEFPVILEKIRSIPCVSPDEEAEEFQGAYYMELIYLVNCARLDKAEELLPDIERGLKKYRGKVSKARELGFCHNIAVMLFVKEDFKQALTWVNKIINDVKSDSRLDIQHFARIFQMILHYEMDKRELLHYELRTVPRYLRQHKSYFPFEKTVIRHIEKLLDDGVSERKENFCLLAKELEKIKEDPAQKKSLGIEEINIWVQSNIRRIPMIEFLKGA